MRTTYLNVCGLISKIISPEFESLILENDLLVFVESKTDELDTFELPKGYTYVSKHRSKCKKGSGGIVIVYRYQLKTKLKYTSTNSKFVQWVISGDIVNTEKDLLLGCIYRSPENSKYSSPDVFNEIEGELF